MSDPRWVEAVGLMTTALPEMEIEVEDPVGMAHQVVAEMARLRADLAIIQLIYNTAIDNDDLDRKLHEFYKEKNDERAN
jgi:hypothetical protein